MADFESQLESVGAKGALDAAAALQQDASKYTNNSDVEVMWALKTHKHAEVYMKLISALDPKTLSLTKFDDVIYRLFKRYFKHVAVDVLKEDDFKSKESKAAWRPFCEQFKGKVEDYNFGTLIRIDAKKDYSDENTMLVTRIQFYAIELARNKRSLNTFHLKDRNITEKEKTDENENNENELSEKIDALNTNENEDR